MVQIRPLVQADIDPLLAILEATAAERLWIATEPGFDKRVYRERWLRMLEGNTGASFVATLDEHPVAMLHVYPHQEFGHVIGMIVSAEHRGKGIGRKLLEAAIAWSREQRLPSVSLLVFPHNERGLALYGKMGFVECARYAEDVRRANGELWDSILMTKDLTTSS